jgi:hypothetical protein
VLTGGTAVALTGSNTVFSDDITNAQVKNPDVGANAIGGGKVSDNSLGSADVAGLTGGDVTDNALKGADVDESSLGAVPMANAIADGAVSTSKFGALTRKSATVVVPGGAAGNGSYATRAASVSCSPGLALSGHAFWTVGHDGNDEELPLIETSYSHNGNAPVGFSAEGGNDTAQDTTLVVAVHCLTP